VADIRIFKGSEMASYTLFELMIWGYCAPVVVACMIKRRLPIPCRDFVIPVGYYMVWLVVVSIFWLLSNGDSGVLQDTKNVLPALVLVLFLFVRIHDVRTIIMLCNLYVIYALLACLLGLSQYTFGGPYFRDLIIGTEYKVGIKGEEIVSPVVGFSGHPNEFAIAILPAVIFAVFKLWDELRTGIRPITIVITGLLIAGMAMSQAKGAMLFTCAAVIFIASPLGRTRHFFLKLAWLSVFIVAIVSYGLHQNAEGSETIEVRYLLWQTSIDAMASDIYIFLFGDGMNFVADWSKQIAGWTFPDAHNAWIDQVLFFGAPAVVLYLMIWRAFYSIVETSSQRLRDGVLLDSFRAIMLALMGDYFFEPVAHAVFPISQLFWLMGLAVRIVSLPPSNAPNPARSRLFNQQS
jgi:hypothetical protein